MTSDQSKAKPSLSRAAAALRRAGRAMNSVFGRLALLACALLVLIQVTWTIVIIQHQGDVEAEHISRLVRLASSATDDDATPSFRTQLSETIGIRFVDADTAQPPAACPDGCIGTHGKFETAILANLPAGSAVSINRRSGEVWVRVAKKPGWILIPADLPSAWRLAGANAATVFIALCIALLGAWQVERPLLRLARAARQLRVGRRPAPVPIEGPSELKALTQDFNEMARAIVDAEQERAVMLAGVAHDLRAPLTRIQVRASMVEHGELQAGFLQDSASLSQIVTQFLDLARDVEEDSDTAWVQVDHFCATRYAAEATAERSADNLEPLILLDLKAGADFTLPGIELDRILSNLIENAFAYGAPPLVISTARQHGHYVLRVTDHGAGMPEADFNRALRPFVRLDAARGGDAHCGLGLTIVRRLTRRYSGELTLSNAAGAGLCVTLSFPETYSAPLHAYAAQLLK